MGEKTLCKLVKKKALDDDFGKYAALVKKPRYICCKCGRAAASKDNLCKPKAMP